MTSLRGTLVPPDRRTASAQNLAYQFLRTAILSGQRPGGTRIRQEAIAAELKISRIPVRDAIGRLLGEGLLTGQPNGGVVVTELGASDEMEIFEMRIAGGPGRAPRDAAPAG